MAPRRPKMHEPGPDVVYRRYIIRPTIHGIFILRYKPDGRAFDSLGSAKSVEDAKRIIDEIADPLDGLGASSKRYRPPQPGDSIREGFVTPAHPEYMRTYTPRIEGERSVEDFKRKMGVCLEYGCRKIAGHGGEHTPLGAADELSLMCEQGNHERCGGKSCACACHKKGTKMREKIQAVCEVGKNGRLRKCKPLDGLGAAPTLVQDLGEVPTLAEWHTFAGGTGAHNPSHNSYQWSTEFGEYHLWPPQRRGGGWTLRFANNGPARKSIQQGLWRDLGTFRSPQSAAVAARQHDKEARSGALGCDCAPQLGDVPSSPYAPAALPAGHLGSSYTPTPLGALGAYRNPKSGERYTVSEAKAQQFAAMAERWWNRANGTYDRPGKNGDTWATAAKQCLAAAFYMANVTGGGDYVYADQLLSQAEHSAHEARRFGVTASGKRALKWYDEHFAETKGLVEALAAERSA